MEARLARAAFLAAVVASLGAGYRTQNFVVDAPTPELAEKIGRAAEQYRHDLAVDWLGSPLPNWPSVCPIHAQVAPNLGAGGATSFMFDRGQVFGWQMNIQGSEVRILDSVLPHEVTHTIFASHFRRPLPRWADEGACTTVEDISERSKQDRLLIQFLKTGRGIAFSQMFVMTEYPQDILPLYAQGYSLARYLIAQKGKHEFLQYVGDGMASEDWPATTERHYGYKDLGVLQTSWLEWVKQGSPMKSAAVATTGGTTSATLASRPSRGSGAIVRAQGPDRSSRDPQVALNLGQPASAADAVASPAVAMTTGAVYAATPQQPKTDLVPVVTVNERRSASIAPVRNGSVALESASTSGVVALSDGQAMADNAAVFSGAAPSASLSAGTSVYGPGAGLIHHSDEGGQVAPAAVPSTASNQHLLEWTR